MRPRSKGGGMTRREGWVAHWIELFCAMIAILTFTYIDFEWALRFRMWAICRMSKKTSKCICPRECDCQDHERGFVSNLCPIHNDRPESDDESEADVHWFERIGE